MTILSPSELRKLLDHDSETGSLGRSIAARAIAERELHTFAHGEKCND